MAQTVTDDDKLNESLAHLDQAARERREELNKLLTDKYTDLKSAVGEAAGASAVWLKEQGREVGDKAGQVARSVDHSVHGHPWYYIGGAALGGLLLGFLLARHR